MKHMFVENKYSWFYLQLILVLSVKLSVENKIQMPGEQFHQIFTVGFVVLCSEASIKTNKAKMMSSEDFPMSKYSVLF